MARQITFTITATVSDQVTDDMIDRVLGAAAVQVEEPDFDGEGSSSRWDQQQVSKVTSDWFVEN